MGLILFASYTKHFFITQSESHFHLIKDYHSYKYYDTTIGKAGDHFSCLSNVTPWSVHLFRISILFRVRSLVNIKTVKIFMKALLFSYSIVLNAKI